LTAEPKAKAAFGGQTETAFILLKYFYLKRYAQNLFASASVQNFCQTGALFLSR